MKKHFSLFIIGLICLVASCRQPGGQPPLAETGASVTVRYAKGFRIERHETYTAVEVVNPWDTTRLLQRYLLVERERPLPGSLPEGTILRTPLQNVAVYTSVHASIISLLGETGRITGVCEPQYVASLPVLEGVRAGRITDLGTATSPDVEKMMDIGTEYIIASPFQNSHYGQVEKLGIPIIEAADYMEAHPLGRAEWGRFYGLLFHQQALADSIFRETEANYLSLKALAETAPARPTVLSEKRYGSFWYVPAGESYIAHLFEDAGADYLFGDLPGQGSTPLAFETVLDRAIHADFWLIKYNQEEEMTYRDLRMEYAPYQHFDAYTKHAIYTCNTGKTPYYEESPIHPDYLLKDLIRLFHPGLLPGYTPRYYRKMF